MYINLCHFHYVERGLSLLLSFLSPSLRCWKAVAAESPSLWTYSECLEVAFASSSRGKWRKWDFKHYIMENELLGGLVWQPHLNVPLHVQFNVHNKIAELIKFVTHYGGPFKRKQTCRDEICKEGRERGKWQNSDIWAVHWAAESTFR